MSSLRPECKASNKLPTVSGRYALEMIRKAVAKRRSLIHGQLDDGSKHCALGCLWDDQPTCTIPPAIVERVAAVNDAHPNVTPHERWKRVMEWFNHELAS